MRLGSRLLSNRRAWALSIAALATSFDAGAQTPVERAGEAIRDAVSPPTWPRVRSIRAIDPRRARPAPLVLAHGRARTRMQLFDARGHLRMSEVRRLRSYLRCHRTDTEHPIHWRLLALVQAIANHWPGRDIIVHSGYRHPKVSHHARRSNHTRGRAIDLRVQGIDNRTLFETLRASFADVGLGYYPNSQFVHLDVRDGEGLWVDYAGPGQAACYSLTPQNDLRSGVSERLDYAAARERGCRR